jgi:hypothetical protein
MHPTPTPSASTYADGFRSYADGFRSVFCMSMNVVFGGDSSTIISPTNFQFDPGQYLVRVPF